MFKYELHAHTRDCDIGAKLSGKEIVRAYYNADYSGIVITDHYFSLFFEWFKEELTGLDHKGIIRRYLKGYYSAKEEGEKLGVTVLCGAEVRLQDTINDYLLYGLTEEDIYDLPLLCYAKDLQELRSWLPKRVLIVQAHPFRNGMTIVNPEQIFGFEVYNNGTEAYRNDLAFDFAKHYAKAMTSGSDCHALHAVGTGGVETKMPIRTEQELCAVLKAGDYSLIKAE